MRHTWRVEDELCEHCHSSQTDMMRHPDWIDRCPGPSPDEPLWEEINGSWIDLKGVLARLIAYCDWQPPGATAEDYEADQVEKKALERLLLFVLNKQIEDQTPELERLHAINVALANGIGTFKDCSFVRPTDIVTTEIRASKGCECGARAARSELHSSWCPAGASGA